jgi:hypothetical protein
MAGSPSIALGFAGGVSGFDANNPQASGFKLTFDDEFNTNDISLDSSGPGPWWDGAQGYLGAGRISVANGILTLHSDYTAPGSGAGITTTPQTFNKGAPSPFAAPFFAEARILMATDPSGVDWDTFWMFSRAHESQGTSEWCEYDTQEDWDDGNGTNKLVGTMIDWNNGVMNRYEDQSLGIGALNEHEWHNIAGSVMQDQNGTWVTTWYVDGKPIYSVNTPQICVTDPMDLLLGVGSHGGSPDHDMLVDWVHVWQKNGTAVKARGGHRPAHAPAKPQCPADSRRRGHRDRHVRGSGRWPALSRAPASRQTEASC